jgi:hypothetical protein
MTVKANTIEAAIAANHRCEFIRAGSFSALREHQGRGSGYEVGLYTFRADFRYAPRGLEVYKQQGRKQAASKLDRNPQASV